MKKIILFTMLVCLFLVTGCGNYNQKDLIKDFEKKVDNAESYYLEGEMEIINNEDTYIYDVKVSYQKNDNYKVELTNVTNNHQQIILRNKEGVYVITPSLNKSFKFQSDWPYNNSQVYLLSSILEDIKNDNDLTFKEKNNKYIVTTKVNYPNNNKLTHQVIYFDKKANINEVQVLDSNDNLQIKMNFESIDLKPKFKEEYFALNKILPTDQDLSTEQTATLEDVIYPMYLPTNTYLTNQEKIDIDSGQRLILTFDGDNPFTLIEETVLISEEHTIEPTSGEFEQLGDTIGVVNDNSINWISNGIEYYVVSDVLSTSELLEVAKSISVLPVSK